MSGRGKASGSSKAGGRAVSKPQPQATVKVTRESQLQQKSGNEFTYKWKETGTITSRGRAMNMGQFQEMARAIQPGNVSQQLAVTSGYQGGDRYSSSDYYSGAQSGNGDQQYSSYSNYGNGGEQQYSTPPFNMSLCVNSALYETIPYAYTQRIVSYTALSAHRLILSGGVVFFLQQL